MIVNKRVIVNRLRNVIADLVDGDQAALIKDRFIVDNTRLAQELLRKYARKRGSPRFIGWIIECVSTTSYSPVLNGHYHGLFHGKRGLRQDDLLLSRGDVTSVSLIMKCLNEFGDMAGLRVNQMKSNIYITSLDEHVRHEILQVTAFCEGVLSFRYLGIPLASVRLRTSYYSLLVDAITLKINS
ncbi:uncharacterized protein [Primulina eburnea]|uniref:uncharacterized protein n=1 Tax=Primulina eburnea TaxID=1245227 RepID=UPI003C6CAE50